MLVLSSILRPVSITESVLLALRDQSCHSLNFSSSESERIPFYFICLIFYKDALASLESQSLRGSFSISFVSTGLLCWDACSVGGNFASSRLTSLFLKCEVLAAFASHFNLSFFYGVVGQFFLFSKVLATVAFCGHFQSPSQSSHLTALVHPPSPPWSIIHNGITTPSAFFWGMILMMIPLHWGQSIVWQLLK